MEVRNKRESKTYSDVDLAIPLKRQIMPEIKDTDCFGRLWDMTSKECPQCADRDICGILQRDTLDKRAKKLEDERGTKYLDTADMAALTDDKIREYIVSGETTPSELIAFGMQVANCDDVIAIKNRIVSYIKSTPDVSVKGGIVWIK